MDSTGTLELRFEANDWNSVIAFEAGIPVELGGSLLLDFAEQVNIAQQIGRTIHLFDWTGVTPMGEFTIESPYVWDHSDLFTTGEVTLLGIPTLSGDFDEDGIVDGTDFLALQRGMGTVFDNSSLTKWEANFGSSVSSPSSAATIPEPHSLALWFLSMAAVLLRGSRLQLPHPR